jgi:hypothetical protein
MNAFSAPTGGDRVPNQGRYSLGGDLAIRGIPVEERLGENIALARLELLLNHLVAVLPVDLRGFGQDLAGGEVPGGVADECLLGRQLQVHGGVYLSRGRPTPSGGAGRPRWAPVV